MRCAGLKCFKVKKGPRDSKFQGIEGPLVDKGFQGISMNWRLQNNPKGYRENMYTNKDFRIMGISKSKGFQGKYIYTFNELASKIPKGFKDRYTQV